MWNMFKKSKEQQIEKNDIKHNVIICMHNDEYTYADLDDDKYIVAFYNIHPNNIKCADFYYSMFANKQVITIDYENEGNEKYYNAIITQIHLIDADTLSIYYTVLYD